MDVGMSMRVRVRLRVGVGVRVSMSMTLRHCSGSIAKESRERRQSRLSTTIAIDLTRLERGKREEPLPVDIITRVGIGRGGISRIDLGARRVWLRDILTLILGLAWTSISSTSTTNRYRVDPPYSTLRD
jgi:hypothetical protein